jgi:DNA-binding Lrp family transcriptional regulator
MSQPVEAYILVQASVNSSTVAQQIRQIEGVERAEDLSGPYDVIVKVTAPNMDSLGKMVVAQIQNVEGITRTLTCPIVQL